MLILATDNVVSKTPSTYNNAVGFVPLALVTSPESWCHCP